MSPFWSTRENLKELRKLIPHLGKDSDGVFQPGDPFYIMPFAKSGIRIVSRGKTMKSASYQYICILALAMAVCCPGVFAQETAKTAEPAWSIPWLEKTSLGKATIVIKRFGRLQRNEVWDPPAGYSIGGIDYLATEVLKLDEKSFAGSEATQKALRDMKSYAYFYKARSRGRKVDAKNPAEEDLNEIMADLKRAVELGYTNHLEILGSKKELHHIFDKAEFKELIKSLKEKAFTRIREGYTRQVAKGFALYAKAEKKTWKPELKTPSGGAFWPDGSPAIVVLSRIHHDGYNKFIGRLEKLAGAEGAKLSLRTAFYQHRADDKARLKQTADYVKALGTVSPYSVIDRGQYKELRKTIKGRYEDGSAKAGDKKAVFDIFQPVVIFFDAAGVPLYLTNGVLDDWQIEAVLAGFTAAAGSGSEEKKAVPAPEAEK